ncbi:hypothetical protein NDA11_003620 [Ustilago hordei]|nr:hypothetical protein NDA11_003620 [Ustilago hordei]
MVCTSNKQHLLDDIETTIMHSLMVESKMQLDLMDVDATWHPNDDLEDSDDDMFNHAISFALIRTYNIISQSRYTDHKKAAHCHGPGCSRSRRVTGSYGRSTGIEDLVEISREHGRSAVSMETMDSYGLTCKGGPSTATRRTKLKEQAQPRRGPSSRSMQMVTTQGLERQEPKELSLIKGGGAVSKESTPGHEEEEQCRRS